MRKHAWICFCRFLWGKLHVWEQLANGKQEHKYIFTLVYCIYHLQIHNKYDFKIFFFFFFLSCILKNVSLLNFTVWADLESYVLEETIFPAVLFCCKSYSALDQWLVGTRETDLWWWQYQSLKGSFDLRERESFRYLGLVPKISWNLLIFGLHFSKYLLIIL